MRSHLIPLGLLGLFVLGLTGLLPIREARASALCGRDNLWAEQVLLAEIQLEPFAAPDGGEHCLAELAEAEDCQDDLTSRPAAGRPGRCDVRFGGVVRQHLRAHPGRPLPPARAVASLPGRRLQQQDPAPGVPARDIPSLLPAGRLPRLGPPRPGRLPCDDGAAALPIGHPRRIDRPPR